MLEREFVRDMALVEEFKLLLNEPDFTAEEGEEIINQVETSAYLSKIVDMIYKKMGWEKGIDEYVTDENDEKYNRHALYNASFMTTKTSPKEVIFFDWLNLIDKKTAKEQGVWAGSRKNLARSRRRSI